MKVSQRQAARELTTAWKFLDNLKELRPKFDQGVGRRDYEGLARAFQEELEHYRLFADILEQELHEAVNPAELLSIGVWSEHKDLPENSKKARYERELRTSGDRLAKIALGIGEGGAGILDGAQTLTVEQRHRIGSRQPIEADLAGA